MCTRPITIKVPCNPYDYSMGYRGFKSVTVPCGKCPECTMKRQKDISVRAFREAQKYGSAWFLTLTYDWRHVPFSHTLLDTNLGTGERLIARVSGLVEDPDTLGYLRANYRNYKGAIPYCYFQRFVNCSADLSSDGDIHQYDLLYTPTLSYRDFSLKMKNFRIDYQRKVGKLDFSFVCIGEYGSDKNASHRPHFHVLFFGLSEFQIDYFINFWTFGKVYKESVDFVNSDGTSGIAKVAAYIGKYAAKGTFIPETVLNKFTLPCRMASSRGLGLSNLESLINYYRAYDICKYDIELCDYPSDKREILFNEILKRLKSYEFPGCKKPIPLPTSLVRKIFNYRLFDGRCVWSKIYYQFVDYARSIYQANSDRIFFDFIENQTKAGVSLPSAVERFENLQKSSREYREKKEKEYMSNLYSH